MRLTQGYSSPTSQDTECPPRCSDLTAFRVAAKYVPMTSVAGDLYDFLVADEAHAGLFIADVSGHGVPAALLRSDRIPRCGEICAHDLGCRRSLRLPCGG